MARIATYLSGYMPCAWTNCASCRRRELCWLNSTNTFLHFLCAAGAVLSLLLIVEIVSTGYYRVIRQHVGDEPLAAMCKLILRDEARHIDFHRDRLATLYPGGFGVWRSIQMRVLADGCASFLWLGHGRCLRALGSSRAELFGHVHRGVANFLSELSALTAKANVRNGISGVLSPRTLR